MDNNAGSSITDLAYDLRQRYAKIVGDHLEIVAQARQNKDYPAYFEALEDLHTITVHKFKADKKEKSIDDEEELSKKVKKDKKKEKDTYSTLRQACITEANKSANAWNGSKDAQPKEIAPIENALRAIEMYLYKEMDDANMFGSKRDTEGLV